jgi:dolichyl-phosphate-mannose--protein O-mannosyl transferase
MVALIAKIARSLFGDSLQAIRFLPALAGATKVLLAGLVARELGGNRFAQILAALAVLVAPGFLAIDNLLSMNSLEALLWTGCAYLLIRVIKTGNQRVWIWFASVTKVATVYHSYSMPSEHFDLFYCQSLKRPLNDLWPELKTWN